MNFIRSYKNIILNSFSIYSCIYCVYCVYDLSIKLDKSEKKLSDIVSSYENEIEILNKELYKKRKIESLF